MNHSFALKKFTRSIFFELLLLIVMLAFLICIVPRNANAKEVFYDSGVQQVRIKAGAATIFRFPRAVQTITGASRLQIEPANKTDPSYQMLSVVPRFSAGASDVNFLMADGSIVKVKIIVTPNDALVDGIYDFKSFSDDRAPHESETISSPVLSEIDLLKAMIRDDEVSGYRVTKTSDDISVKDNNARVTLLRIYKGGAFNGFVFKVVDTSSRKNIEIDVRKFSIGEPNLAIVSQSDEAILYPKDKGKSESLVRVVAKNTASSRDFVFPLESMDSKPESKSDHKSDKGK